MTDGPWLWLLSGPNGAGKSTYAPVLSSDVEETVRPDELAYGLSPSAPENAALRAGRLAIQRIENLFEERRSFAVETTLSGRFHLDLVRRAKNAGWKVGILYIGLRSARLATERVRLRELMGGHHVPIADIRRRYTRSLKNLAILWPTASRILVLDNSSARQPIKRVLEVREGEIVFRVRRPPKWLSDSLSAMLRRS
jgi:predicted ABC-type ATPase